MDIIFVLLMGGLWGSFANVCIYRLPKRQGVVSGRSHCPKCKKQIVWYDNIPIISYFLLGGKCRKCKKKISILFNLFHKTSHNCCSTFKRVLIHILGSV